MPEEFEPIAIVEIDDPRSRAEKVGSVPARLAHTKTPKTIKNELAKMDRIMKANARHIFAQSAEELALICIDRAKNADNANERTENMKMAQSFIHGRPSTVNPNELGSPIMPVFNIKISGNSEATVSGSVQRPFFDVEPDEQTIEQDELED